MTHLFTQMKACATHATNWGMKQASPDPKEQLPTMLHSEGVNTIQTDHSQSPITIQGMVSHNHTNAHICMNTGTAQNMHVTCAEKANITK